MTWQPPGFWQPAPDGEQVITAYSSYTIGPLGWRDRFRALAGRPVTLGPGLVAGHLPIRVGRIRAEATGGGGPGGDAVSAAFRNWPLPMPSDLPDCGYCIGERSICTCRHDCGARGGDTGHGPCTRADGYLAYLESLGHYDPGHLARLRSEGYR